MSFANVDFDVASSVFKETSSLKPIWAAVALL